MYVMLLLTASCCSIDITLRYWFAHTFVQKRLYELESGSVVDYEREGGCM